MFPSNFLILGAIYLACGTSIFRPADALWGFSMQENVFKSGIHNPEANSLSSELDAATTSPSSTEPTVDDNMTPKKNVNYLIFQDEVGTTPPNWDQQGMSPSNQLMWYVFSGILVMITIVSIMISGIVLGRWLGRRDSRRYGEDGNEYDEEEVDFAVLKQQNCYKLLEEFDMENMDRAFECDDGCYVTAHV